MSGQNKVSGVVLAGGLARRMQQQDKGLVQFQGRAMISYALAAMSPLVDELLISANRHQHEYGRYGLPVIGDSSPTFDGPLAGILAAMRVARHPLLLVTPCDSPLIGTAHLQRLLATLNGACDAAVAFDGARLHPVVMVLRTRLQDSLSDYLHSGERKMANWLQQQQMIRADFSDMPAIFANINTPNELLALEAAACYSDLPTT
ncbi:MAG: molybdenum cofactor guanylyltransferase [Methylococcales bacterium]|nr:molybdenum cofactor guanylyltransferase [Methylococcales bacterium]